MPTTILLAEDDPIAREVLTAHLDALGLSVHATASASEARALGANRRYFALLFDRRLLGGSGIEVLRDFRNDHDHPNHDTPAIAMSAELDDELMDALFAAGFVDAMEKPVTPARLRIALNGCVTLPVSAAAAFAEPGAVSGERAVLDDAAGLRACGSASVLEGLRGLLAAELPGYAEDLRSAHERGDARSFADTRHRLRSALGFCGATELLGVLDEHQGDVLPDAVSYARCRDAMDRLNRRLVPMSIDS